MISLSKRADKRQYMLRILDNLNWPDIGGYPYDPIWDTTRAYFSRNSISIPWSQV